MKKMILIIGEPGSGKSTVVKELIKDLPKEEKKHNLLRYYETKINHLTSYIFGIYFKNELFEGTDKLSMGVQPSVCDFLLKNDGIFISEGDRLGNKKLILFCKENNIPLELIHLHCDNPSERRLSRGTDQSESFLKSRRTKITNILNEFKHHSINNKDVKESVNKIIEIIQS